MIHASSTSRGGRILNIAQACLGLAVSRREEAERPHEIEPGDKVLARDVSGRLLERRAMSSVIRGRDFLVIWVAREEEWEAAQNEGRDPDGVPWPAEDVELQDETVTV